MRKLLSILLVIISPLAYGKMCKKGKPCGNSCINISYTCHIGAQVVRETLDIYEKRRLWAYLAWDFENEYLSPNHILEVPEKNNLNKNTIIYQVFYQVDKVHYKDAYLNDMYNCKATKYKKTIDCVIKTNSKYSVVYDVNKYERKESTLPPIDEKGFLGKLQDVRKRRLQR